MKIESFQGEHRFLSNFFPALVNFEGISFPTVEHAYQAAKTLYIPARIQVSLLPTPGGAKRFGRGVAMRPDWDQVKLRIMKGLLQQKFNGPTLGARLAATGDAELIEGNHWGDTFWGVCRGSGENHLGKLLMEIRRESR